MKEKFIPMIQSRRIMEEIRKKLHNNIFFFLKFFYFCVYVFRKEADAENLHFKINN